MAHCPNPECRHQLRTGKPAEYRDDVPACADCGADLLPGPPPVKPRAARLPWPGTLPQQVALTLIVMLSVAALGWLPHPLLDLQVAGGMDGQRTGPFCLGVRPLLVGFVLVELVALALPFTRTRRRTDPNLRRWLWPVAVAVGLGLAMVQGLSMAIALENMGAASISPITGFAGGYGPPIVPAPGWAFRLATAVMMTAGVATLAGVVWALDRWGLGPGMAALLLADGLVLVGEGLVDHARWMMVGGTTPLASLLALVFLGGLVVGAWRLLGRGVGRLPTALPVCGLLPWELALTLLLLPTTVAAFGVPGGDRIADLLRPGGGAWVLISVPITLLVVPLAATLYHWRRRHWWTGPERGPWLLALVISAAVMLALVLLDAALMGTVPFLVGGGLITWITLVALLGDASEELQARRRHGASLRALAWHQDLPDALAQLAELQREDPDGAYVLTGRRFRALTWFFGPYVPLRILGAPSTHSQG